MKKVTAYETEDGKLFDNQPEAAEHEVKVGARDVVEGFRFAHRSPSQAEMDEIVDNIVSNWFYFDRLFAKAAPHLPIPASEDDS